MCHRQSRTHQDADGREGLALPLKGHQGRAMAPYHIYWFGPNSHIVAGENIECASDEEAQAKAAREAIRNRAAKGLATNYCVVRLSQAPNPVSRKFQQSL
jgi:hypothetical protein